MRRSIPLLLLRRWKDLPADAALGSSPTGSSMTNIWCSTATPTSSNPGEFSSGFSMKRISGAGHEFVLAYRSAMLGNWFIVEGFPNPDLETTIEMAVDLTQMGVRVELVVTQFGVVPLDVPMPPNISLVNDGWICPRPKMQENWNLIGASSL